MASQQYTTKITCFNGVPFTTDLTNTITPSPFERKLLWLKENYLNHPFENIQYIKYNSATGDFTFRLSYFEKGANYVNYVAVEECHGKNFFGFIHGCQYINDGYTVDGEKAPTFEFYGTIDPLMTYLVDQQHAFVPCSIKRHGVNTTKWINHIPEQMPFGTGPVYSYNLRPTSSDGLNLHNVYILVALVPNGSAMQSTFVNGVPNGLKYVGMNYHSNANQFINQLIELMDDPDQIKGIWLCPLASLTEDGQNALTDDGIVMQDSWFRNSDTYMWNAFTAADVRNMGKKFGGDQDYIAVYDKTCMYPYHYAKLSNAVGAEMPLKFEEWDTDDGGNYQIGIDINSLPPVCLKAGPARYDAPGQGTGTPIATLRRCAYKTVQMGGYPQGSWAIDNWYAYHAQNENTMRANYIMGAFNACASVLGVGAQGQAAQVKANEADKRAFANSGGDWSSVHNVADASRGTGMNIVSAGLSTLSNLVNTVVRDRSTATDLGYQADAVHGETNCSWSDWVSYRMDFVRSLVGVSAEVAERIDMFFERYGYDQGGKIDIPNPSKPSKRYCYIQTLSNCVNPVKTMANQNELDIMNNAIKNGVTFWTYANTKDTILTFDTPSQIGS